VSRAQFHNGNLELLQAINDKKSAKTASAGVHAVFAVGGDEYLRDSLHSGGVGGAYLADKLATAGKKIIAAMPWRLRPKSRL
jgi:hypothetical protein